MPKPATVEDEEPTPVSPIEEKPVTPVSPAAAPAPAATPSIVEQSIFAGSVNELQTRFEDLLINHPRLTPSSNASSTSSPITFNGCTRNFNCPATTSSPSNTEIPVARGGAARDKWFAELAAVNDLRQNAIRNNTGAPSPPCNASFSVYCNNCTSSVPDEHYHCSTCDDGDFDLCQACVDNGVLCGGDDHWMIKRFVKGGKVINSTTETIEPKVKASESKTTLVQPEEEYVATRTCNCCIQGK